MKITNSGKKLTKKNIALFEKELNICLPDDYKKFMLKHNGGEIEDEIGFKYIETDAETGKKEEVEGDLYEFVTLEDIPEVYDNLVGEVLPEHSKYLPIAFDGGDSAVLLCVDNDNYGKIYFGDCNLRDPKTEYYILNYVAGSFTEFLSMLYEIEE